jgi:hypothetical protein
MTYLVGTAFSVVNSISKLLSITICPGWWITIFVQIIINDLSKLGQKKLLYTPPLLKKLN